MCSYNERVFNFNETGSGTEEFSYKIWDWHSVNTKKLHFLLSVVSTESTQSFEIDRSLWTHFLATTAFYMWLSHSTAIEASLSGGFSGLWFKAELILS